jgi:hypothetical protein
VDVDTSLPALVFKSQLFTLTGVPPERQKIMGVKNPPLKARSRTHPTRSSSHVPPHRTRRTWARLGSKRCVRLGGGSGL